MECINDTENCGECFTIQRLDCEAFPINAGLSDADYWLILIDQFNGRHVNKVTVTGGIFEVDPTVFPEGLLGPFTGSTEIRLYASANASSPVTLTIDGNEYRCLLVDWQVMCCGENYSPPDPATECENFIAGLTTAEKACICENIPVLCDMPGCLDATVTVNEIDFDTVASGGILNVPVKNTLGSLLGSLIAGIWTIADTPFTVNIDGVLNQSGSLVTGENETINISL